MTVTVSPKPPQLVGEAPYVGLTHFTEEYADRFFGRETEYGVIVGNLSASRLTLLYAESGVGKSSLLRAGVAARIHEQALRDMASGRPPRFVVAVFSSWTDDAVAGIVDAVCGALEPFVDGRVELPTNLESAIETATSLVDTTLLVILDQFEEYFLYHRNEHGGETLADQLARCLKRPDLRANFLISIREDMYAGLGDLFRGRIANVYGNFLHLEYLDREGAREAIVRPIERLRESIPELDIEPGLVEAVLDGVRLDPAQQATDGRVATARGGREPAIERSETAYLQLVMKRLWDEEMEAGSTVLRLETLRRLGGTQEIIEGHLNRAMDELPPDEQDTAASAFRFLVTRAGTKIAWTSKDLAELAEVTEPELDPVLRRLSGRDLKILRPITLPDGRAQSYEIFHDALARPIVRWREDHAVARERAAKEEAQTQAAEATRREVRERRRRRVAVILLGAAVAALLAVAAAFVVVERQRGGDRLRAAQSLAIADRVEQVAGAAYFPPEAVGLSSVEALRLWPTFEARRNAIVTLQENAGMPRIRSGHTRAVLGVAFAPQSSGRLASAGVDGKVRIWSPSGRLMKTLRLPEDESATTLSSAASVAFDPNGEYLAVGRNDGGVDLWNSSSPPWLRLLRPRQCDSFPCTPVAFSPDGNTLAAGADDGIRLWDVRHLSRPPQVIPGYSVNGLAFDVDGTALAAASDFGVSVWGVRAPGRIAKRPEIEHSDVGESYAVAWAPNGRLAAGAGTSVVVWSADGREEEQRFDQAPGVVNAVAFLDDGSRIVYGGEDQHVTVRDIATGRHMGSPRFHLDAVNTLAVDREEGTIAAGSDDGIVKLWPADASGALASVTLGVDGSTDIDVSPEGPAAAASNQEPPVYVWSPSSTGGSSNPTSSLATLDGQAAPLAMSGGTLATTSWDTGTSFALWDVGDSCDRMPQAACRLGTSSPQHSISAIAFDPDTKLVVTGSFEGWLSVWDVSNPDRIRLLDERKGASDVNEVAFSPYGGGVLATAFDSGRVVLWRYEGGELRVLAMLRITDEAYAVAFSPTARLLAAGGADQGVTIWDITNPARPVTTSQRAIHTNSILALAFSSDGRLLAAGDGDGAVCPYDVTIGEAGVPRLRSVGSGWCLIGSVGGDVSADAIAFDPTARVMLSTGRGQPVYAWDPVLWGAGSDAEIERAVCRFARRQLRPAEWQYAFVDTKLENDRHPTCG
jgi:WD40 repeat protein